MSLQSILSQDIIGLIILYSGDRKVLYTLRRWIDPVLYKQILLTKRRILIYGQVQSGKTAAIMESIQNPLYNGITKIVIIQNSSLVLQQYQARFKEAGIDALTIDYKSRTIHKEVILLMNNNSRLKKYMRCADKPERYIVYMDESDSYDSGRHPLANSAIHEYYITATPKHKLYLEPGFFHTVKRVVPTEEYSGLRNLTIDYTNESIISIIQKFKEDGPEGMMLINAYKRVAEMRSIALQLSQKYKNIVFVTLNSKRRIIIGGDIFVIKARSLSEIIDALKDAPRIVFIANRMSLRGLSYCSSDYSRHLTHQYSDLFSGSVTNSLQRLRILGKYTDKRPLKLFVPEDNEDRIKSMFRMLDMQFEVCRDF